MSAEIISFTQHRMMVQSAARARYSGKPKNMRSLSFRSRAVTLEIDDAVLLDDVRSAFDKAMRKYDKLREHLQSYKERTAKEIEQLTRLEAKLGAAIEAVRSGN